MAKRYVVESDFEYKRLRCIVTFGMMGHRCGYVGIPKGHKFYGKNYCDIERLIDYGNCHGGLTYSSDFENSDYPVKSNLWWFGFDCAHYGDGKDLDLAIELFPNYREQLTKTKEVEAMFPTYEIVRNKKYVEKNCKSLADQLA